MKKQYNFRFSDETIEQLSDIAKIQNRNLTNAIENMISEKYEEIVKSIVNS